MRRAYLKLCRLALAAVLCGTLLFAAPLKAEEKETLTPQQKNALAPLVDAANKASISGPAEITILDQAFLSLPKGYGFVPKKESEDILRAIGQKPGKELIGVITSGDITMTPDKNSGEDWLMLLTYAKPGYVRDTDAANWNTDKLLGTIRASAERGNPTRIEKGFPAIRVKGWAERPSYDPATHQLLWSILVVSNDEANPSVNYETIALGRDGYIDLDLVTKKVDQDKPRAHEIMSAIRYNSGKHYEDFNAQNDKIAEFGLAALVTGLVAKKLGLLALAGVFFVKVWKFLAIGGLVFLNRLKKFKKKKTLTTTDDDKK